MVNHYLVLAKLFLHIVAVDGNVPQIERAKVFVVSLVEQLTVEV